MLHHPYLDGSLVFVMLLALAGYFHNRLPHKASSGQRKMGIGARGVQFIGMCLLIPSVVILSLECKLSECTTGTIVGAIAGYLFSSISRFDDRDRKNRKNGEATQN
jgi:hypothetical protein